jgi:ring-1,2-phenylacetyl-CoA epoxidase subunit PaaD
LRRKPSFGTDGAGHRVHGDLVYHAAVIRAVMDILRTIDDPEMPLSIVDLGIVDDVRADDGRVHVVILPTFVGCPALAMIEELIRTKVGAMPGVRAVDVRFVHDPPWSVDRISEKGRALLKAHGVTVPACGPDHRPATIPLRTSAIPCPFCGSTSTRLDSPFGPTRCRMIYYCEACRNGFEHMKRIDVLSPHVSEDDRAGCETRPPL